MLRKKGAQSQKKKSVGIIMGKPIWADRKIPGQKHLKLNGKLFQFKVDSGARDNVCSRQI